MAKPPSTWKAVERAIAKLLGVHVDEVVQRVPVTGRTRGDAPDIRHPYYALEVKHGKRAVSAFLKDAFDQATKSVRGDQIPMVVLHATGTLYDESLVVVRIKDLEQLRNYGRTSPADG